MPSKFDYSNAQSLAVRSLKRFGTEYTFTRVTESNDYDPATDAPTSTTTNYTSNMVWLNFSRSEIDGDSIKAGDAAPLLEHKNEPANGDTFQHAGVQWRIVSFEELQPANDVVLYRLQVRRGS